MTSAQYFESISPLYCQAKITTELLIISLKLKLIKLFSASGIAFLYLRIMTKLQLPFTPTATIFKGIELSSPHRKSSRMVHLKGDMDKKGIKGFDDYLPYGTMISILPVMHKTNKMLINEDHTRIPFLLVQRRFTTSVTDYQSGEHIPLRLRA